jgi:hypothetical protein|tara:strand:+ start:503 stop:697 length:195 start_codon:yes stop_codon:yes gene_type:complete
MKILGYILIVVGLLDIGLSWTASGSPIDSIVGPTIAPFTGYILTGLGYYLTSKSGDSEDEDQSE